MLLLSCLQQSCEVGMVVNHPVWQLRVESLAEGLFGGCRAAGVP